MHKLEFLKIPNLDKLSMIEKKILFNENLNLLLKYYNNKKHTSNLFKIIKVNKEK